MKLLLAADPAAAEAMATLGAILSFRTSIRTIAEQLAACRDLAAAIKTLLAELSERGPAAVRERLQRRLGRDDRAAELNAH